MRLLFGKLLRLEIGVEEENRRMIVQIGGLLNGDTVNGLRQALAQEPAGFRAGTATAGWYAKEVKNNEQAAGPIASKTISVVSDALNSHAVFRAVTRPKALVGMLVSRYGPGMEYGSHVDNALMNGMRTDLSFTVFLASLADYDGGELVIEGNDGEQAVKLEAGSAVIYPSTSLHRVAAVTKGERLVVVGWVRSMVRSAEQREVLFDLDQMIAGMREDQAQRSVMGLLLKTKANLMRMWVED